MKNKVREKLLSILKDMNIESDLHNNSHLRKDLNLDSLDVINFLFEVEGSFNIKIPQDAIDEFDLLYIDNLVNYILKDKESD